MFTYINPTVREKLIAAEKLIRIDESGERIDVKATPDPGALAVNLLGPIPLPISLPTVQITVHWYAAVRSTELSQVEDLASDLRSRGGQHLFSHLASFMAVNSVLMVPGCGGDLPAENPLVRVHSNCLTGDVFGSQRCECGPQLAGALHKISTDERGGYLIYMAGHEGRGIGLWAKAATYLLQDGGEDTYQANRSLGLPDDSRDFSDAAVLLKFFVGDRPMRLLTNNPKKLSDLAQYGLTQIEAVKHVTGVSDWNRRYLRAKQNWGHQLDEDDIDR